MLADRYRKILPILVLQFGFAVTGIADTVLGPLLPTLAPALHLKDSASGLLLLALFSSSSCGALLARGSMSRCLALGFGLMTAGAICMSLSGSASLLLLFCLVYGLGLGLAMTATSLFIGRNYRERRGVILSVVNFIWSLGAALSPLLVARLVAHHSFRSVFGVIAMASLLASLIMAILLRDRGSEATSSPESADAQATVGRMWLTVVFALMLFLETGVEVTLGGWLSTFAGRTVVADPVRAAAASSFFWTAFLVGRALSSIILLKVKEESVLRGAVLLSTIGATALLFSHGLGTLAFAAALAGLGAAPIFPLSISLLMANNLRSTYVGLSLAICGTAGAIFPWVAGLVSAHTGSIRLAMVTPVALQVVMIAILLATALRRRSVAA